LLREFPSGAPPPRVEHFSEPSRWLREFAASERVRFERRLPHLPVGSVLRVYELQYGLELGSEPEGPQPSWDEPAALEPYPASVRARRIAVAIRCGRKDLDGELARAARAVVAQLEFHLLGNHLLENALGLVCAASVTRGIEAELWWRLGSVLLSWQLDAQFLADGGHFELSASYHLLLTAALLETIELVQAGGRTLAQGWRETVSRALAWAAAVRAPDGTYPLFNDASLDSAPTIDAVLDLAGCCNLQVDRPPNPQSRLWVRHLPFTGWILAGSEDAAWLCVDAANDGAPYQPGHAHADALTFELWVEGRRTIVDYGVSSYAADEARTETRSTRSHNTVQLDDHDSCEVWHAFRVGRRARSTIRRLERTEDAVEMDVEHDGYSWLRGRPIHRRGLCLRRNLLRITDHIVGGSHRGTSRLRLDAETKNRIQVSGSSPPRVRPSSWYLDFADRRPADVLEQPVYKGSPCTWMIQWHSR